MAGYDVAPDVAAALQNFTLPERLGFGLELTGFDEQELASAMLQQTDGLTDPDDCPPVPDASADPITAAMVVSPSPRILII